MSKHKIALTIEKIKLISHIDTDEIAEFDLLLKNKRILREEGTKKHFCAACFIVNIREKKIFLGNHIKAGFWLSGVGGHMDIDESPEETARREFVEELSYKAPREFELFDIIHFENVNRPTCADHYDFLFLVRFDSLPNFKYDKKEFHSAQWLTFNEALRVPTVEAFTNKLKKLIRYISS